MQSKAGDDSMYLHLGQNTVITTDNIVGIFDIDGTTVQKNTRDFLSKAERDGNVVYVSAELPKSFIVCKDKKVYISQISPATLLLRSEKNYLNNV